MIKLSERLPNSVSVKGRIYKLDLDFRNVLRMIDILGRNDLLPEARDYLALKCIMKHPPKNTSDVLLSLKPILFPETKKEPHKQKLTSFEQDADLIRGAFLQEYGINLFRDKLHWIEFQSLLSCLPDGNRYTEVLGIRAKPIPKPTKYNSEERANLMKAKEAYRLWMTDSEREKSYSKSVQRVANSLIALAKKGSD